MTKESYKGILIDILDQGLRSAFNVEFKDLVGNLKPNTLISTYAACVVYYLKNNLKLRTNTIALLFDKSHDKIAIQLNKFNKHIRTDKKDLVFTNTISKDRKALVDEIYPKFLANVKTFVLEVYARKLEKELKEKKKDDRSQRDRVKRSQN